MTSPGVERRAVLDWCAMLQRGLRVTLCAGALAVGGCSERVEHPAPPNGSLAKPPSSTAVAIDSSSVSPIGSVASPVPKPEPSFTTEEAFAILYPEGGTLADIGCTQADAPTAIRCLIDARYKDNEK